MVENPRAIATGGTLVLIIAAAFGNGTVPELSHLHQLLVTQWPAKNYESIRSASLGDLASPTPRIVRFIPAPNISPRKRRSVRLSRPASS